MSDEASLNLTVVHSHEQKQAEDGSWNNAKVETEHTGYTGTGYVNTENDVGNYIELEANIPSDSTGTLIFRYANGSSTNRIMTLTVNGDTITSDLDFVTTNAWTNWSESSIAQVPLDSGNNSIRITANTDEGAPNLDRMDIYYYYNHYNN